MKEKNQIFAWMGISENGEKLEGEMKALSINLAKLTLSHKKITLISINKKPRKWTQLFPKKISTVHIAIFFRQLATLITAGIPLVQSIELIQQSQEQKKLNSLLQIIKKEIIAGKTLSNSLKACKPHFDNQVCQLIFAGEQSGKLTSILSRIAHEKEKTHLLKNKIQQALFYPFIITFVSLIVSLLMLFFVVPRFAELYANFQGKLPAFTLAILSFSSFLKHNSGWLIIGIILFICLVTVGRQLNLFQQKWDRLILFIPFVGLFFKKVFLARFTRSLATTFSAGLPITDALKISAATCGNQTYIKAIEEVTLKVLAGKQIHTAMQLNELFTPLTVQMIEIGEESGTLDYMLEKIAEQYENEIDHIVAHLSDLLEPLIMVVLGVLIGGLVIAMYLPIFKLGALV